ncbi:MAG: GNAT family N-acetyltransferase [Elusimicrobiota bacterium]|jgi:GNAT superfamily N-acetyltransferase
MKDSPQGALSGDFPVALIFFLRDAALRRLVEEHAGKLCASVNPFDLPNEVLRFHPVHAASPEEFGARLIEVLFSHKGLHAVVVSDQLVEFQGEGRFTTSNLADVALESFYSNHRLCSLIALGPKALPDIPGITLSLDQGVCSPEALRDLIVKAGTRLHLLSPSTKAHRDSIRETGVRIQVVQSPQALRQVFRLRHRVYGMAGYLDSETEKNPLGLEMDYHDGSAVQLLAMDDATGNIAGVLRMIFAHKPWGVVDSVFGSFSEIFEAQRGWFQEIVEEVGGGGMRERLLKPGGAPLPLLQNLRVKDTSEWQRIVDGAEVSRIITAPEYRGLGVAQLLTRLAIAAIYDMGKDLVVGECQPVHMPMYRKLGFKAIEGEEGRVQDASGIYRFNSGQRIVIDLKEGMKEKVTHIARGDLSLVRLANKNLTKTEGVAFTVRLGQYRVGPQEAA